MEKFTKQEKVLFQMIKEGKSKNQILQTGKITACCLPKVLTSIFKKTDEIVKYRSTVNKFQELQFFTRNNPDAINISTGEVKKITPDKECSNVKITFTAPQNKVEKTVIEKVEIVADEKITVPAEVNAQTENNKTVPSGFKKELLEFIKELEEKAYYQQERASAKIEVCNDIIGWINTVEKACR